MKRHNGSHLCFFAYPEGSSTAIISLPGDFKSEVSELSVKGQILNIFNFASHLVSVATTPLCNAP